MRSTVPMSILLTLVISGAAHGQDRFTKRLHLACDSTSFGPSLSLDDLARRFGSENVVGLDSINVGEGEFERVSVLFRGDPQRRVDIVWRDTVAHRNSAQSHLAGESAQWTTAEGITLGTRLRTLEHLNGGQFRVAGFGFDGSGFIKRGWSQGRLGRWGTPTCDLSARLSPTTVDEADHRWLNQVGDGRFFSSGHLAMQALDPRVNEIWLVFKATPPHGE